MVVHKNRHHKRTNKRQKERKTRRQFVLLKALSFQMFGNWTQFSMRTQRNKSGEGEKISEKKVMEDTAASSHLMPLSWLSQQERESSKLRK
eukprot:5494132-Amphidinium_carterae.2